MNYTRSTDSCQAHLPVQHASNMKLIVVMTASHTWVPRAKQASCLLHWLSVFKLAELFSVFYTLTKQLNWNDNGYIFDTKLF